MKGLSGLPRGKEEEILSATVVGETEKGKIVEYVQASHKGIVRGAALVKNNNVEYYVEGENSLGSLLKALGFGIVLMAAMILAMIIAAGLLS